MTREHTRWTQDRIELIQQAIDVPWLKPGRTAVALGVHRGTVNNMLADGRLTYARRGGSRLRWVLSTDVLRLVLEEINQDERAGCDMGYCSRTFAAQVRRVVGERTVSTDRTPCDMQVCDQENGERGERTNDDPVEA